MRKPADPLGSTLERFRIEIDAIDDEVCSLLERRFAAVELVRSVKSEQGQGSPIRPAPDIFRESH